MNYDNEKREKLERLEKKLYSRKASDIIDTGRSEFNYLDDQKDSSGNL